MAKCVYSAIFYPESMPLQVAIDYLDTLKCDYRISPLHDSDVKEDGTPKKPHYHVLLGYDSKPPKFIELHYALQNRGFAVPPTEKDCKQVDPVAAERYQAHEDSPDKAQYKQDDAIESSGWDVEKYVTQEQRNARRRAQKSAKKADEVAQVAALLERIGTNPDKIGTFAGLIKWASRNDSLQLVMDKAYFFRTYIDSINYESRKQSTLEYTIAELEKQTEGLAKENENLRERLAFAEQSAALYYEQLFGETAPPSYAWGGVE